MSQRTNVVNAKVFLDGRIVEAGVSVVDERIDFVGKEGGLPKADRVLDVKGRLLLPGLIDVHAHLRDSELSYKEDFASGTAAAVAGGFTTVLDMPNTKPPITTKSRLLERFRGARDRLYCDVGFYATPRSPGEALGLAEAGCVAMKAYMSGSLEGERYSNFEELKELMKRTAQLRMILAVHAEDPSLIKGLSGDVSASMHAKAHPPEAEERAIRTAVEAARRTGGRLHIAHISTRKGIELVRLARLEGVDVSCEATPHHLFLTCKAFKEFGKLAVVEPPLRKDADRGAVLNGVALGGVEIIATDHAPHALDEKVSQKPRPGFPGLETALPVLLTLVKGGALELERVIGAMTEEPAKRFGLMGFGRIHKGYIANMAVVDLKEEWRIDARRFFSKAKHSPFDGRTVSGRVMATFVRGREAFSEGELVASEGVGRVVYGGKVRR